MYALDTAGLGPQLGSTATDYVLPDMTERGVDKGLSGKLEPGADAVSRRRLSGKPLVSEVDKLTPKRM